MSVLSRQMRQHLASSSELGTVAGRLKGAPKAGVTSAGGGADGTDTLLFTSPDSSGADTPLSAFGMAVVTVVPVVSRPRPLSLAAARAAAARSLVT